MLYLQKYGEAKAKHDNCTQWFADHAIIIVGAIAMLFLHRHVTSPI